MNQHLIRQLARNAPETMTEVLSLTVGEENEPRVVKEATLLEIMDPKGFVFEGLRFYSGTLFKRRRSLRNSFVKGPLCHNIKRFLLQPP